MVAPSLEAVEPQPRREDEPSAREGEGSGILVGGIVAEGEKGILVRGLDDDGEECEEQDEPERKKPRFLNMNQD
jgi:hypothetical protein